MKSSLIRLVAVAMSVSMGLGAQVSAMAQVPAPMPVQVQASTTTSTTTATTYATTTAVTTTGPAGTPLAPAAGWAQPASEANSANTGSPCRIACMFILIPQRHPPA